MAKTKSAPARPPRGTAGKAGARSTSSPAKVAANRRNAKKSRGRPPAALPTEVLAELGAVPVEPAEIPAWLLRAAAVIWRCEASGVISGEYASRLRNGLGPVAKFLPAASSRPAAGGAGGDQDDDEDEFDNPGGPRVERVDDPHTPIAR